MPEPASIAPDPTPDAPPPSDRTANRVSAGPGRVLVGLYALFALAATGRATMQIIEYFNRAPLAYILSAVAAVLYLVAAIAIAKGGRIGERVATIACSIELVGVLATGLASYLWTDLFPDKTVWSHFGQGYGYLPLALPILGLAWLVRQVRGPSGRR